MSHWVAIFILTLNSCQNGMYYTNVCLSLCLSLCLSVSLSVSLSVYLSVCLSLCLSVYLSVHLSLSICYSVHYRGWEQLEVTCNPRKRDKNNIWNIEGNLHEKCRFNLIYRRAILGALYIYTYVHDNPYLLK